MPAERGKNRETMFAEWWECTGRFITWQIAQRKLSPEMKAREMAKFGYIWGWLNRAERDAKKRRRARSARAPQ